MTIYVTSDTHFGHGNIIEYCKRPFVSAAEMDEFMVQAWNEVVKPSDHVYHLGDVAMRKQDLSIVRRLNGHKRLVFGNHDIFEAKHYIAAGFEKVMGMRVLDGLLFTHIPVHPGSMGRFRANVHGHVHQSTALTLPYINVCVEVTNYAPVALDVVSQQAREAA